MASQIKSVIENSAEGTITDIECHISKGLPAIVIVGFANKAVEEAKERLRGAFSNSGLPMPKKRITINLAPADIPKYGTGFDLAIATAILSADQQCSARPPKNSIFIGELGLDGSVRPVRGVIGKLLAARDKGFSSFFIPEGNAEQARLVPGVTLYPAKTLRDVYLHFSQDEESLSPVETSGGLLKPRQKQSYSDDMSYITGQKQAKRALEIAAAGGHNILLNGPPGTGKSMLARTLPSILPELDHEEILEVTHIHSLASRKFDKITDTRPFRAPHHSASDTAIIGGGQSPRPGEISLSHRGVLFFDELPEFSRSAIEALRQPLEDRVITVARAKESAQYPANFLLVATANPCPCGYYGTNQTCQCLPYQVIRYDRKISGPIIDRIDLYVNVEAIEHEKLLKQHSDEESSSTIRQRVEAARQRQQKRFRGDNLLNCHMDNQSIKKWSQLEPAATDLINKAAKTLKLSARGYMRTIKVARTIADLEKSNHISPSHITEALQYRRPVASTRL